MFFMVYSIVIGYIFQTNAKLGGFVRRYSRLTTKTRNIARVCGMLDACGWVDTDPTPDPSVELPYWTKRLKYSLPPDGYVMAVGSRYDPHTQPDTLFIVVDDLSYGDVAIPRRPNMIYIPRGDDTQILESLRGLLVHWDAALRAADERRMLEAAQYKQRQIKGAVRRTRKRERDAIATLQALPTRSPAEQEMLDRMVDKANYRRQRDSAARKQLYQRERDAIATLQALPTRSPAEQAMLEQWRDKYRRHQIQQRECVRRYQARQKAALADLSARTDLSPAEQAMLSKLREKAARKRQQNRERVRMWRRGKG